MRSEFSFCILLVKRSIKLYTSVTEECYTSAYGVDSDAAFHLEFHCLPKYLFTGIRNEKRLFLIIQCSFCNPFYHMRERLLVIQVLFHKQFMAVT